MSCAPHPALRRLLAAAATPGRFLESLDAAAPELAALARDLEGAALVVDRSLEPLARGIDLASVLGRAAAPRDRAEPASGSVRGHGSVRPDEPLPSEPPRRPRRTSLVGSASDRPGLPTVPHDGAAVAAVLARFAPGAEAGPASRESISGEGGGSALHRRTDALPASGGTTGRRAASTADAVEAGDGGRRLPTREEAAAEMRRRTAAAAADGGLDTPVRVCDPEGRVADLLRDVDRPTGASSTAERPAPGRPSPPSPATDRTARDDGHLHEVLERVRAAAARRLVPADGARTTPPAVDPFGDAAGSRRDAADVQAADPARAPRPAAVAAAGGLRGLAQRAEAAGQVLAPRGAAFPSGAAEPAAGVVAARMDEAELAERIDRLLRREARRQGIDLEGVGP